MYFYHIAVLKKDAPTLTYESDIPLAIGAVVEIPLFKKTLKGVVLKAAQKPEFECKEAIELPFCFSNTQIKLAEFITSYYFSSYPLSFGIFTPFSKGSIKEFAPLTFKLTNLSKKQQEALDFIESHQETLLFGDTGSGKTEIYIHAMHKALQKGENALFLMPEISLTPQMEKRLSAVFGDCVAFWHSKITKKKKEGILKGLENGSIRILAGARSALFLPLYKCGVIIIDEEHDDAYKSSSNPRYHARDVALYLSKLEGIKIILGSATPLASTYHLFSEKNSVFRLKGTHFNAKKEYGFIESLESLDPFLLNALRQNFMQKKQSLIFLPTRANFKHLICQNCATSVECPNCSVSLSLHKKSNALKCHYCHFSMPLLFACPKCGGELRSFRIGTQEFASDLQENFKEFGCEANIMCFDRDCITTQNKLVKTLNAFNDGRIDVLVGTQMLTKGHDYHNVSLSVALGLDYLLKGCDYRARERALAIMFQLSGRSGRKENGKVLIQTLNKDFFNFYLNDFEVFLKDELEMRADFYPPFARLALVHFASKNRQKAESLMKESLELLNEKITKDSLQVEIVGSGEAPIAKIANKFRFAIFLRSKSAKWLHLALLPLRGVDCEIDIDPLEFN